MIPLLVGGALALGGAAANAKGATTKTPNKWTQPKAQPLPHDENKYYLGGSQEASQMGRQTLQNREGSALTAADMNARRGLDARGQQQDVYGRYQGLADGTGPSVGREMLAQGMAQAQARQNAAAAAARGGAANQALALRGAQQTGADLQMQAAGQGAVMGQQEQFEGIRGMGGMAGQIRSGDAQAQAMAEGRASGYAGLGFGYDKAQLDAQMAEDRQGAENAAWLHEQRVGSSRWLQEQSQGSAQREKDRWFALGGSLLGAGGSMVGGGATGGKK
jgi:hypothetical protein